MNSTVVVVVVDETERHLLGNLGLKLCSLVSTPLRHDQTAAMHLGLISRKLRILAPRGLRTPSLNRHQLLQDVFQRIPPFSQIAVLMLAIWGPTHAPLLFSAVMMVVMLTFVASNARTAWGMRYVQASRRAYLAR